MSGWVTIERTATIQEIGPETFGEKVGAAIDGAFRDLVDMGVAVDWTSLRIDTSEVQYGSLGGGPLTSARYVVTLRGHR